MKQPPIGIDLGTTTSIISAFIDNAPAPITDPYSKSPIVPSVIGLNRAGELLVGQSALDRGVGDVIRESKRGIGRNITYNLGEKNYSSKEVAAIILRYLKVNAERYLAVEVRDVVITVPANYEDTRRRATKEAAEIAGLNVIRLINEPTAAAMAYGLRKMDANDTLLVYDFGGGTLDVSILEMIEGVLDVKASYGVAELGGKDFDHRIADWAAAKFLEIHPGAVVHPEASKKLKTEAERAKMELSETSQTVISLMNYASESGAPLDIDQNISQSQFQVLVKDLVETSLNAVDEAIKKAGISRSEITKALLVGGTTHVPFVSSAVHSHLTAPFAAGCEPDLAVANGACISAALAAGVLDPTQGALVVQDVCTYGLGTTVISEMGGRLVELYSELMPPNTPIPYTFESDDYTLLRVDQVALRVDVVQDLTGNAVYPEDTAPTGASGVLQGIPPSETGEPHQIRFEFSYDVNGIVTLNAYVLATGQKLTIELNARDGVSASRVKEETLENINDLWNKSPLAPANAGIVRRAELVLSQSPSNMIKISEALAELKTKISMNDRSGVLEARSLLIDLLADSEE